MKDTQDLGDVCLNTLIRGIREVQLAEGNGHE